MPPLLPKKRLRSLSPGNPEPCPNATIPQLSLKGKKTKNGRSTTTRKPTLFDDLDAGTRPSLTSDHGKALLEKIRATEEDSDSSLSSLSGAEFEDVVSMKRQNTNVESDNSDEDVEFEDVETPFTPGPSGPVPTGDLELTLVKDTRITLTHQGGVKKGLTKLERQTRVATHQVHVQMLMWHNAIRNSWLCDDELQGILVDQLPPNVTKQVERWRDQSEITVQPSHKGTSSRGRAKEKGKKSSKKTAPGIRSQWDWGEPAERAGAGEIDMSHGDPLFRILAILKNYWKQRFRIIAPGLRKRGYMSLQRLDEEIKSFAKAQDDLERHGERFKDLDEFKRSASSMEGSRDVGAQLFTALLRGLGLEARMIASLQPVGFGWNKNEDAMDKKEKRKESNSSAERSESDNDVASSAEEADSTTLPRPAKRNAQTTPKVHNTGMKATRRNLQGTAKASPIAISDTDASVAEADGEDDDSVVDITPVKHLSLPSKPYDKDLLFPHYWTEVLSPVTKSYIPVDPIVLNVIATNPDMIQKFEPRGQKSEKAKQVIAYIVGYSPDGTAKDVTIRYLKNHMLPGRTRGNRMPDEKVPVHNFKGKIKRYEQYDWFKTVMRGYVRGSKRCPRTEIDDHEEATDLRAAQPKKKEVKEGEETLQSYKTSAEFILERHLKRDEAILPTGKHVKMFTVKGKGGETTQEKVFLRKDVVNCKSMETWHKEGREPNTGAIPRKRVPYRAATTNRKRELAEAEHASGEKMLQGLYSRDQTDWITPPPIENGVIPKNAYGNMDVYVPSMVPDGAMHVPMRGTMRLCKRLGIDYAEAVTGFEFGARMAIPIVSGVVIAVENYDMVMEQWERDEAERVRKEDEKRTKAALGMWRKMMMGMRVIQRVREEYGGEDLDAIELHNPFINKKSAKGNHEGVEEQNTTITQKDEDVAGEFLPEGYDGEETEAHTATFFPVVNEEDNDDGGGGFLLENTELEPLEPGFRQAPVTPDPFKSVTRSRADQTPDTDGEKSSGEEARLPAPKKRGRPAKITKKVKLEAMKPLPVKQRGRSTISKRNSTVVESEQDGKANPSSSGELPDPDSQVSEASSESKHQRPVRKRRRVPMPLRTEAGTRGTLRRTAKRVSKEGLKSKYFERSSGEESEVGEG